MTFFSLTHFLLSLVLISCTVASINPVRALSHLEDSLPEQHSQSSLSPQLLATFMHVEGNVAQSTVDQQLADLNKFVSYLKRKQERYRSEERFLSFLFYKVHRKYLKRYQSHTTLYSLLENGYYDCVTGSALYALLLDALGIHYQVHEFPYHVYLTVVTEKQDTILLESTDPRYGFVSDAAEQAKRYQFYSQVTDTDNTDSYYQYDFTIRENIGLTELAGLSYFNEAVEHYNQQEFQQAMRLLRKANQLYHSPRMTAFESLMTQFSLK